MEIRAIDVEGYEQVVRCEDPSVGLVAIIAVHSTTLGPALGGARFYPFDSEDAALTDVLRLSRGMTYKSAVCGNDLGGGKSVALVAPERKTPDVMRAFGRFVHELGGRYITAADVGTNTDDMVVISEVTPHVGGLPAELGGSGDPSPLTALGVFHAMRAAAAHRFGSPDLTGRHVVVAGVGKVGAALVDHLVEAGARITATDVRADALDALRRSHGIDAVAPDVAHKVECDVLAPCALGGVLTPATIPDLGCATVVGAANNQLATSECGDLLAERGVLYVPDYLANAGGVINIAEERRAGGYDAAHARARVESIYDRTAEVLKTADERGITPVAAAGAVAHRRLATSTPPRS